MEQVSSAKVLGGNISQDLSWNSWLPLCTLSSEAALRATWLASLCTSPCRKTLEHQSSWEDFWCPSYVPTGHLPPPPHPRSHQERRWPHLPIFQSLQPAAVGEETLGQNQPAQRPLFHQAVRMLNPLPHPLVFSLYLPHNLPVSPFLLSLPDSWDRLQQTPATPKWKEAETENGWMDWWIANFSCCSLAELMMHNTSSTMWAVICRPFWFCKIQGQCRRFPDVWLKVPLYTFVKSWGLNSRVAAHWDAALTAVCIVYIDRGVPLRQKNVFVLCSLYCLGFKPKKVCFAARFGDSSIDPRMTKQI